MISSRRCSASLLMGSIAATTRLAVRSGRFGGDNLQADRVFTKMSHQFDDAEVPALRVVVQVFGAVWLANAVFQTVAWLVVSNARENFVRALAKPAANVPGWIRPLLLSALHGAKALGPQIVAACMVVIAVVLGLALLTRKQLAVTACVGVIYSTLCWVFLDGFGFPYGGGQTDPGVFVAYAIAFLFVLSVAPTLKGRRTVEGQGRNRLWHVARISFGVLWLFDAALKWLPAFLLHFSSQITSAIPGQPHWVAAWLGFVAAIIHAVGPIPIAVIVALVETAIAIALLRGRWLKFFMPFGIVYSLAVWSTAEAFGGPYSTAGTGVRGNVLGNILIYLIPFLFLWAGSQRRRAPAP